MNFISSLNEGSIDWCPYCKYNAVDLDAVDQEIIEDLFGECNEIHR